MASKELVKKEKEELAQYNNAAKSWGHGQEIEAKDIILPMLYTLNPMSKMVTKSEGEYKSGMIVRSTDKKALGDTKEGVSFVPFMYTKFWKIEKQVGTKFDHVAYEAYTPDNALRPISWLDEKTKIEMRANAVLNFYCLLSDDIERENHAFSEMEKTGELPDPADAMFPTCIRFSRTSYKAGKELLAHFTKAQSFSMNPAVTTFNLKSVMNEKDDNTWYALDIEKVGKTPKEHIEKAAKWYHILAKKDVIIDDSEEVVDTTSSESKTEL